MNIEQIIIDSIKKLSEDFEARKSIFTNIIHENIDILSQNAEKWFGEKIPREYSKVLYSLLSLAVSFNKFSSDYRNLLQIQNFEEFSPYDILFEIYDELLSLSGLKNIKISNNSKSLIKTSKSIFRDSIYSLFLSFYYLFKEESNVKIDIVDENTSVKLYINFLELIDDIPSVEKLLRTFYYNKSEDEYNIRLGLSITFSNIKQIGGIIKIKEDKNKIEIEISFPSLDFLNIVEGIRNEDKKELINIDREYILLSFEDKILEILISEIINDNGFIVENFHIDKKYKWDILTKKEKCNSIIVDYENITKFYNTMDEFIKTFSIFKRIIIIVNSDYEINDNISDNVVFLKKPFNDEKILQIIK